MVPTSPSSRAKCLSKSRVDQEDNSNKENLPPAPTTSVKKVCPGHLMSAPMCRLCSLQPLQRRYDLVTWHGCLLSLHVRMLYRRTCHPHPQSLSVCACCTGCRRYDFMLVATGLPMGSCTVLQHCCQPLPVEIQVWTFAQQCHCYFSSTACGSLLQACPRH